MTITAEGLQKHSAYPNDALIVRVNEGLGESITLQGVVKLQPDATSADITIFSGRQYTFDISSIEAHFGGFSNCGFKLELRAMEGEKLSITYSTVKSTCDLTLSSIGATGERRTLASSKSNSSTTQFKATVQLVR